MPVFYVSVRPLMSATPSLPHRDPALDYTVGDPGLPAKHDRVHAGAEQLERYNNDPVQRVKLPNLLETYCTPWRGTLYLPAWCGFPTPTAWTCTSNELAPNDDPVQERRQVLVTRWTATVEKGGIEE